MGKNSLMDHIIMSELMKTEMAMASFSKEHIIETLEHIIETIKKLMKKIVSHLQVQVNQ